MSWTWIVKEGKKKVDQEGLLHVISTCLLVGERLSIIRVSCWIIQQEVSSKRRARTIHDSEKFALRESQACQAGTAKLWVHQEELSWPGRAAEHTSWSSLSRVERNSPCPHLNTNTMIMMRFNQLVKPCLTAQFCLLWKPTPMCPCFLQKVWTTPCQDPFQPRVFSWSYKTAYWKSAIKR